MFIFHTLYYYYFLENNNNDYKLQAHIHRLGSSINHGAAFPITSSKLAFLFMFFFFNTCRTSDSIIKDATSKRPLTKERF